jgi:hypothetical protein
VVSITPRPFYPQKRPGTHYTGGWVGPRAGMDVCEKSRPHRDFFKNKSPFIILNYYKCYDNTYTLCSAWIRSLDRPARSQSLYRLSYPAHNLPTSKNIKLSLLRASLINTSNNGHQFSIDCCCFRLPPLFS